MQNTFIDTTAATLLTYEEISGLQTEYSNMLSAIMDMLVGAKYLWEGGTHE